MEKQESGLFSVWIGIVMFIAFLVIALFGPLILIGCK